MVLLMPKPGDEVIVNYPTHWAHGHVGLVIRVGRRAALVQLSTCQGSTVVRLDRLES
ncbi:hypotheical protein [Mycobacterium phage PP]|uniref:Hypotheical protein n=1 Tax=Mycobacterium phage PP TaxID=2077134 RepID=A0A2Z5XVJ2_9CAUD|nr:hypothetical protein KIW36_gp22 [Mycobacterium phage PP]BBC53869.1 hypotheical protein [Mycobacterium phage PP]